jgi:hypothetical protein
MNVVKRKHTSLKKASREPHFKSPKWKNQIKKKGSTRCVNKNRGWSNSQPDFEHVKGS